MARVELASASFSYPIYELADRSLKMSLMRSVPDLRRIAGRRGPTGARVVSDRGRVRVQALDEVSFTLRDGDRLGLIGHNGAGKSTLLRVVAGLAHPQSGRVRIEGRVVS